MPPRGDTFEERAPTTAGVASPGVGRSTRRYRRGPSTEEPRLRPVTLAYTKHPDRPHWWHETVRVGEDEHGVWLGMGVGARYRRGDEPWIANAVAAVLCVPHDGWWCLIHNGPAHRYSDYVDICTPPRWDGDHVTMVDLDLDVVRHADGRVEVVDRDEFEEHRRTLDYPAEWVRGAETAATAVAEQLRRGSAPFGDVARSWRRRFLASVPADL